MNIKLKDIIEAIESREEGLSHYYNKNTGIILYIIDGPESKYKASHIDNLDDFEDWEIEIIKQLYHFNENKKEYIKLPTTHEINEYDLIVEFCNSMEDDELGKKLLSDISGDDFLHKFRSLADKYGVLNNWYDFQENFEKELAIKWCISNNINFRS